MHKPARLILPALLAALVGSAAAANTAQSHRCDRGLVVVGDSIAAVYKACGQPARVVQLENRVGAAAGERLEYFYDRKAVLIVVQGGKVTRIEIAG
jgi:hypothetical protein